jgi:uncharacterized secreted protein with C-terminal beta-propeller domain
MNFQKFKKELKKEYNDTFKDNKPKFKYVFKLRHAFIGLILLFMLFLTGEHISVSIYNNNILQAQEEKYSLDVNSFIALNSKNDYSEILTKKERKHSIISSFFNDFSKKAIVNDNDMMAGAPESTGAVPNSPGQNNSQTNTNVQVSGIDEADYSKCDGTYIYSLTGGRIEIYNLAGEKVIDKSVGNFQKLYVTGKEIVLIGNSNTAFYEFDDNELKYIDQFEYKEYNDSRLANNTFYLIFHDKFEENKEYNDTLYYDRVSNANYIYTILKYDLEANSYTTVKNLNAGNVILYMSKNYVFLATTVYTNVAEYSVMTVVSIFDYDLNAIAALRVKGGIVNQFSMDEYENYFRIVSTNQSAPNERLNSISIFDLENKNLVGYLDEGIGLDRQTVRSVRFEKTTCYVVTYFNSDPLYEIDLSDPTKPIIISEYQSPGFSSYLHTFVINGQEYLFGIGYCDDMYTRKISVYKNDDGTTQIGKDLLLLNYFYTTEEPSIVFKNLNHEALNDHKALFIYQEDNILYLGVRADITAYYFFKIDVNASEVITVYDVIEFKEYFPNSRCYLVDGKIYITCMDSLYMTTWEEQNK